MRIVCISDTHNQHRGLQVPDGDLLIHSGDATGQGSLKEVANFLIWMDGLTHRHKVLVAGNHDFLFETDRSLAGLLLADHPGITYLQDSGCEIEGLRIWGSPWQPFFMDWAFNLPRRGPAIRAAWEMIPIDTDVLITHGPPHGVLDQVHGGEHLGCEELRIRLGAVKPRLHVFGHIHDSWGVAVAKNTTYINACTCNEGYQPLHRPIVVDLQDNSIRVPDTVPSRRQRHLTELQALLAEAAEPAEAMSVALQTRQVRALEVLADVRGVERKALVQDYVERGLAHDLAKLNREESKPSRRPVPLMRLD